MSSSLRPLLVVALLASVVLVAPAAVGEPARPPVTEAEVHLVWGEQLGRAPILLAGASMEFSPWRALGLTVGGLAAVASPRAVPFLQQTAVGGGGNLGVRLYLRGGWPRAFGIGAATSLVVADGVAMASPRMELFYRFVLFDHLSLRPHAAVGGMILWDTAPGDARPGPLDHEGERYVGNSVTGFWVAFGVALGYAP